MRALHACWLAIFLLCAVFLPLYGGSAETKLDAQHANRLIWEGRFHEAEQYLESMFQARQEADARFLCLTYPLWGKDQEALAYCDAAASAYPPTDECVRRELQRKGAKNELICPVQPDYDKFAIQQRVEFWEKPLCSAIIVSPRHERISSPQTTQRTGDSALDTNHLNRDNRCEDNPRLRGTHSYAEMLAPISPRLPTGIHTAHAHR